MDGHVYDVDGTPWSAFDKALEVCRKTHSSLIVDQTKPGWCVLTKNKKPFLRIAVVREPKEFKHDPMEKCCFCGQPTPYWVRKADVACCQACAAIHALEEVPNKQDWIARNKEPHEHQSV